MNFWLFCKAMLLFVGIWMMPDFALGQLVAKCGDPTGYGYFHHRWPASKDDSGFQEERIRGGLTTLKRLGKGDYDILMVDATKQVTSYKQEGYEILLFRRGELDATFLALYPGRVIELYTFYKDAAGENRYDNLVSKGGDEMLVHKSTLMSGKCSELNLDIID